MAGKSVSVLDSIDDVHPNQWNNLVAQSELGTLFHRHEWLKLLETHLGQQPRHVVIEKGSNPVALFPNFYDSLHVPGWETVVSSAPVRSLTSLSLGYGGPVIAGDEDECLDRMFDVLEQLRGVRTLYHWVRTNDPGYIRYGQTFADHGYTPLSTSCRFRIDLAKPWDDIRAEMDSDHRRRLRQMEDHNVEFRNEPIDVRTLRSTYDAHTRNLERKSGDPLPFIFFEGLADLLSDRVKVVTVVVDGQEVGQYLYLLDDEQSTIHYYLAAIGDEDYFQYNPSQLLHAHTIQWGQDEGYQYYDFGSTGADYTNGVFRHKEGYGGEPVPTVQWRKGFSRLGWPAFRAARTLYRKTKA